ncbi:DUF1796 family putative cysteine peptidase [Paenibacillus sp. MMS20-IR301]|uniref:DUF1796 family putative cysteine peptidase n=1 Tax=Paenibacillus sp. MMS20-IR301 TaxID=2895946 RepID=UPI0028EC669E|nr:DUF1796 family putative cysteine peptidase [Paenibacillus sp. MMS20-IR301]WNS44596.1 DUF1796 family putative cysteine peptidase [Paenibacillus sp. MMS20-IR301]
MNLAGIKGGYDCIISLGSSCEPAAHLRRKGLRVFSSPLDWVVSLSLTDVNRLLGQRFSGYMELPNMGVIDGNDVFVENEVVQPVKSYFIKDYYYNVISVHDFPVLEGLEWYHVYPGFKEKINMRSRRLLDALAVSRKVLFIRWGGTREEAVQLQSTLGTLTGGEYQILIVNGVDGLESVVDREWSLPGIASLGIPNRAGDCESWDYILEGIYLNQV